MAGLDSGRRFREAEEKTSAFVFDNNGGPNKEAGGPGSMRFDIAEKCAEACLVDALVK